MKQQAWKDKKDALSADQQSFAAHQKSPKANKSKKRGHQTAASFIF